MVWCQRAGGSRQLPTGCNSSQLQLHGGEVTGRGVSTAASTGNHGTAATQLKAALPPGVKEGDGVVHAAHAILIRAIAACDEDA
jgi:hypothetical protein